MNALIIGETSLEAAFANELDNIAFGTVVVVIVTIICITSMIKSIAVERARQTTKRELAAYIAEGSISAEDAVRMLNAGRDMDAKEAIARSAADGWISPKKADQLIQALEKPHAAKA